MSPDEAVAQIESINKTVRDIERQRDSLASKIDYERPMIDLLSDNQLYTKDGQALKKVIDHARKHTE